MLKELYNTIDEWKVSVEKEFVGNADAEAAPLEDSGFVTLLMVFRKFDEIMKVLARAFFGGE